MPNKEFDPQVIATTIMGCVQETLENMCKMECSKDPEFVTKEIIEYNSRLRVVPLEKFNKPCYISVINFFEDQKLYKNKKPCGAFILYIEEEKAKEMVRTISRGMDDDDEDLIMDNSGEICNVIAGQFKNELKTFGFIDLVMSAPDKYKNSVPAGVNFKYSENKLYEFSFFVKDEKCLVIEVTLAPIPQMK